MHLLYLDDSGSAGNAQETHLVLAGLSLYEAQAHYFTRELDALAAQIDPQNPHGIEFHASDIFSGRCAPWQGMKRLDRLEIIKRVLRIVANSYNTTKVFICAIHKPSYPNSDSMELAFEDLCSRFNMYLCRLEADGDRQRGLIVLDNSSYETSLQRLARDFRSIGTRWGVIRTLADTPMFLDSRASRVIQVADHIAYAGFRRYESGDSSFFDIISARFDQHEGRIHGLVHKQTNDPNCMCPACLSRRLIPRQQD